MKCFTSWKEFASASATAATPSERPIDVRSWTGLGHLDDTSTLSLTVPEETAVDVASWLRNLGLERYEATFRENDVNAEVLPNLTAEDLRELGVTSFGHRRRLLEAIAALRPEGTPADDPVRFVQPSPTEQPRLV